MITGIEAQETYKPRERSHGSSDTLVSLLSRLRSRLSRSNGMSTTLSTSKSVREVELRRTNELYDTGRDSIWWGQPMNSLDTTRSLPKSFGRRRRAKRKPALRNVKVPQMKLKIDMDEPPDWALTFIDGKKQDSKTSNEYPDLKPKGRAVPVPQQQKAIHHPKIGELDLETEYAVDPLLLEMRESLYLLQIKQQRLQQVPRKMNAWTNSPRYAKPATRRRASSLPTTVIWEARSAYTESEFSLVIERP